MSGFSPTGFVAKTIEEVRAEIVAVLLAKIDAALDLSEDQPVGQVIAIAAQREAILWELLAILAKAIDPDAAEDWLLDALCALTGTKREPAKKSTVTLTCNVDDNFNATAGQITANVVGQEAILFVNKSDVETLTPAGDYPIVFEATEYGPIRANAGTLTVITAPVSGLNSVTNALDAAPGALRENDTALRVRREQEISATGACTPPATRSDVLQVPGVQQSFVFENVTNSVNADGLPAKSFETVIYDGDTPEADDDAVAQAVWKSKPSGAETYGTTTVLIFDEASQVTRAVKFSRATVKDVYLELPDIVVDPETFPDSGVDDLKEAIAAAGLKRQNLAIDVVAARVKAAAFSIAGVLDVPTLYLGFSASPVATANLEITGREIASIDTSRITIATVEGVP